LQAGPALGGAGPNAVLFKTGNVLLCVLEQPRVDNSSAEPFKHGIQLGAISPIDFRSALLVDDRMASWAESLTSDHKTKISDIGLHPDTHLRC